MSEDSLDGFNVELPPRRVMTDEGEDLLALPVGHRDKIVTMLLAAQDVARDAMMFETHDADYQESFVSISGALARLLEDQYGISY